MAWCRSDVSELSASRNGGTPLPLWLPKSLATPVQIASVQHETDPIFRFLGFVVSAGAFFRISGHRSPFSPRRRDPPKNPRICRLVPVYSRAFFPPRAPQGQPLAFPLASPYRRIILRALGASVHAAGNGVGPQWELRRGTSWCRTAWPRMPPLNGARILYRLRGRMRISVWGGPRW